MAENMMNQAHKTTTDEYREGWDRIFGKKPGLHERLCTCGHRIELHEDFDFNIHECQHGGCQCLQFRDIEVRGRDETA